MAFCGLCGKEIAEGEVCSCMTENQSVTDVATENPFVGAANQIAEPNKGTSGNNKWLIPGIAVAAVVVVLVFVNLLFGGGSYKEPIDDFISLMNKKNLEESAYQNALRPDFAVKCYNEVEKHMKKSDDYADELEDKKDNMEDNFEDLEDELGKWKLSFEMKSKEKIDKGDLEDIQDDFEDSFDYLEDTIDDLEDMLEDDDELEDYADLLDMDEKDIKGFVKALIKSYKQYDKAKISAGYDIKGKFVIKTKDDEFDTGSVKIRVVKVNGDWCYAGTVGDSVRFDMDDSDVSVGFIQDYLNSSYLIR